MLCSWWTASPTRSQTVIKIKLHKMTAIKPAIYDGRCADSLDCKGDLRNGKLQEGYCNKLQLVATSMTIQGKGCLQWCSPMTASKNPKLSFEANSTIKLLRLADHSNSFQPHYVPTSSATENLLDATKVCRHLANDLQWLIVELELNSTIDLIFLLSDLKSKVELGFPWHSRMLAGCLCI